MGSCGCKSGLGHLFCVRLPAVWKICLGDTSSENLYFAADADFFAGKQEGNGLQDHGTVHLSDRPWDHVVYHMGNLLFTDPAACK